MQTLADTHRKARKQHVCQMCRRWIEPGEIYKHQVNADGGSAWTWKECAHCEAAVRILNLWDKWMDAPLEGFSYYEMQAYEPESIAEARMIVGWRTKWRRKDGTLREVPAP